MDPIMVLRGILNQMSSFEPDRDVIAEELEDLLGWMTSGGYVPRIAKQGECTYRIMDTNDPDITQETLIPQGDEE